MTAFETILKATLLLVLSVSGNFGRNFKLPESKILNNMFVKHIINTFYDLLYY